MKHLLPLLALFLALSCSRSGHYIQVSGQAQGGTYTVKLNLDGVRESPEAVRDSIEALLIRIDTTLSGYNKLSQLSRFNGGETIRPNALFLEMYDFAYRMWQRSGGAVDCAAGPLFDAWGFGFREGTLPTDQEVARLREQCGMGRLPSQLPLQNGLLDPSALDFPRLNFNAVAQGYSCDKVAAYLYSLGIKDMLVDIGEIFCDGLNPSGKPWRVGIDKPEDGNNSPGAKMEGIWESNGGPQGVVTSGNYRKFYIKDGVKYSHTIDPRTGYPVQHKLLSATVIAPTAMAADAYATYCMVIGTQKAQEFILSRPDLEACLISEEIWTSPGFKLQ